MFNRSLKTAAIATVVLLGTTAGAFAATTAWADGKSKIKEEPSKWSDTIDILHDGDKVKVFKCFKEDGKRWCKIKYDGDIGYVLRADLDFHKNWGDDVEFELEFGSGGFEVEIEF